MELGLPIGRAKRVPDQKIHELICNLHEAQHLVQVRINSTPSVKEGADAADYFNNYITCYYEEADADMAAHSKLRRANFGHKDKIQEALIMDRHKRYMGVLFNHPKYWFAPFLDAVEKNEKPPDFYAVHASVMEIRLRLLAEADRMEKARLGLPVPAKVDGWDLNQAVAGWREYPGASPFVPLNPKIIVETPLTSATMVEPRGERGWKGLDNVYLAWREEQFFQKPEIFYTIMRHSLERGDFSGNPLTQNLAGKIVEAANYFDPSLTQEPNVQALISIPRKSPLPTNVVAFIPMNIEAVVPAAMRQSCAASVHAQL